MKLIIKFPTRNRPEKFLKTLDKYIRFLDDKSTPIIVTCDTDDITMQDTLIKEVVSQYENVKLCFGDNDSKISAVNADLKDVDFDIVLLASDDMIPIVKGFDTIIKTMMLKYYPDTDGVLWFNDGFQKKQLNTLCILGKKYYDRFGYIYHPEYFSVWCDVEFMEVANILGKQTYFEEVIIQHQHPDWGYGENDLVHRLNLIHGDHDGSLFNKRKANNFYL